MSFGVLNFPHAQISDNQEVIESDRVLYNVHHCYIDGPVDKRKKKRAIKMKEGVKNSCMMDIKFKATTQ